MLPVLKQIRLKQLRARREASTRRTPSGRGGTLGTPSGLLDEAPPSIDQEANSVVSGGGVIGSSDRREPSRTARSTSRRRAGDRPLRR